jgi:hypothetical protein
MERCGNREKESRRKALAEKRTRRKTLLQFVRFIRILQHERVQEPIAPDLEFDVRRSCGFLDAGGWKMWAKGGTLVSALLG